VLQLLEDGQLRVVKGGVSGKLSNSLLHETTQLALKVDEHRGLDRMKYLWLKSLRKDVEAPFLREFRCCDGDLIERFQGFC